MIQTENPKKEFTTLLVSVFILAVILVWIRALTVKSSYQFVGQERQYRQLEQDMQALRVRWLKITSPKKLESIAAQLGLEPAKPGQNLKLQPSTLEEKKF
ncbi:MAG: hypothetical protein EXR74_04520 [Bdellovibrionales bacterium]|nr:hypothetical protein [Bdellovibrionales bacterium]